MPEERIARVRFFDEGALLPGIEEISLYDLNSHPVLQYNLGDHVLIRSNLVNRSAYTGGIVEEVVSLATGWVGGLMRSITDLADDTNGDAQQTPLASSDALVDWMGEIVKISTDGTAVVRLARPAEPPENWAGDQFYQTAGEDLIVFEGDEDEGDEDVDYIVSDDEEDDIPEEFPWMYDFGGDEDAIADGEDEWEDAWEGGMDEDDIPEASVDGMDEVEPAPFTANGHLESSDALPQLGLDETPTSNEGSGNRFNREKCAGFDILETVADDHPFKSDNTNRNAADWLARIRKEHKILQTSLPGIHVYDTSHP